MAHLTKEQAIEIVLDPEEHTVHELRDAAQVLHDFAEKGDGSPDDLRYARELAETAQHAANEHSAG